MIREGEFGPYQKLLLDMSAAISDRCLTHVAADGNDLKLWNAINEEPRDYGASVVSEAEATALLQMSALAGGWITWYGDEMTDPRDIGLYFLSSEEWAALIG